MNVVFADAFYFVARLNRRDQHHARVMAFSRNFRARILTTDWVLMEVADALAASESVHAFRTSYCTCLNHRRAKSFLPTAKSSIALWNYIISIMTNNGP
jgi:hypothetical protein